MSSNDAGQHVTWIVGDGGKIVVNQNINIAEMGRIVVMEGGRLIVKDNATVAFSGKSNSVGFYNAGDVTFPNTVSFRYYESGALLYNASTGTMKINESSNIRYLYNYGSLEVEHEFTTAENSDHPYLSHYFYNQGYLKFADDVEVTAAKAVNYGELKGGVFMVSDDNFFNGGIVELNSVYVKNLTNFGRFTVANHYDEKGEWFVVNACYLHITDPDADNYMRKIVMLRNSLMDIEGSLTFETANGSYLEDKSLIDIKKNFTVANNGARWDAPTTSGEYAIVKIGGNITTPKWDALTRPNEGALYLDWAYINSSSSHCTIDNIENYSATEAILQMLAKMASDLVSESTAPGNVSIAADEDGDGCTGNGYNGTREDIVLPTPEETPRSYRYCFEDNFPQPGDYDFNDCVITVTPKVSDNVVDLTVSLDAVGASKQLAAAIRIVGLDYTSFKNNTPTVTLLNGSTDMDYNLPNGIKRIDKDKATGEESQVESVGEMKILTNGATSDDISDVVIRLFNDAHWAINPSGTTVDRHFYNTVDPNDNSGWKFTGGERKRTITYRITFSNDDTGKALAAKFNADNLDVFIVETHNNIVWEVHTYKWKWVEVIKQYTLASNNTRLEKLNSYRYKNGQSGEESEIANYPWAICVPGDFRYPYEWYSICGKRTVGDQSMGDTSTIPYQYFASWAQLTKEQKESTQTAQIVKEWYNSYNSSVVWGGNAQ